MKKDIKFTQNEAIALRNITSILIGYHNSQYGTKQQSSGAKILLDIHIALDNGERQFGFSDNIKEFLINIIQFWYNGVAVAVLNNNSLQGHARKMFTKHYNLVPSILKKLS